MALYTGLLNSQCSIFRLSGYTGSYDYSSSDFGEVDETWSLIYTGVRCRKDMSSTGTLRLTGGMIETGGTTFYFKSDQDVEDGDRIELASKLYLVNDVIEVEGLSSIHHKEARVQLVDWEGQ
jgi:hypothetical protein